MEVTIDTTEIINISGPITEKDAMMDYLLEKGFTPQSWGPPMMEGGAGLKIDVNRYELKGYRLLGTEKVKKV